MAQDTYKSAFPDDGQDQLGDPYVPDDAQDRNTVVDEPVLDGLGNAVENSEVRTRSTE